MSVAEWEDLMSNGAVVKKVLNRVPQKYESPEYRQYVHIHLIGRVHGSQEAFIDTYRDNKHLAFPLGDRVLKLVDNGVMLGIKSMRKGEICALKVNSRFGYGPSGYIVDKKELVPANADLEYRVELLDIGLEEPSPGECSYNEVESLVNKYKLRGNFFYRQKKVGDAENCYKHIVKFLHGHVTNMPKEEADTYDCFFVDCLSNLAACYEQQGEVKKGLEACIQVHILNPRKVKNLLRIIRFAILKGEFKEAKLAYAQASEILPDSAAVKNHGKRLAAAISGYKTKKSKMFTGFLEKDSSPDLSPKKGKGDKASSDEVVTLDSTLLETLKIRICERCDFVNVQLFMIPTLIAIAIFIVPEWT